MNDLSDRLAAGRPTARRAWSRLAFAGALSTLVLGMFASFGGLGYTAAGATSTYQLAKKVVVKHQVIVDRSSAAAQYQPPPSPPDNNVGGEAGGTNGQALGGSAGASGNLPFTGFSLLATFVVGLALLGAGIFLRLRERRNS